MYDRDRRRRIVGLGAVLLLGGAFAVMAADVFVGPPPFNPNSGQQVSLYLVVDVGSAALGSYFFRFQYNPAVVHVVSVQGGTTAEFAGPPTTDPSTFASGSTPLAAVQGNVNSPHGFVSVARVTLQALGQPGDSSTLSALVNSLFDTQFNALPSAVFPSSLLISVPEVAVATDFRFLNKQSMTWTGSGSVTSYNVYRGTRTSSLFSFNHSCLVSGLGAPNATDPSTPQTGKGYYYLVSGVRNSVEGTLGTTSTGQPRPNALPCSGAMLDADAMLGSPFVYSGRGWKTDETQANRRRTNATLGDVEQDGFIDREDSEAILQGVVGVRDLTAEQWAAADVDGDGRVTVADAQRIMQFVQGARPNLGPSPVGVNREGAVSVSIQNRGGE